METFEHSELRDLKIVTLMKKYAIPCIISLLVGSLYNIVDQIFIANSSDLGTYGNAANTVVFPLTIIALSIAVMIGDGCCAYMSLKLGEGENEKIHKGIGTALISCLISSVFIMGIYLIFSNQLLSLFGGMINEITFNYCRVYLFWLTIGIPFYMFGQMINPIIRADGSPKKAMIYILLGTLINIILDPLFLFVFKWGMAGAAIATIIGQIITASLSIRYLMHLKTGTLNASSFRFEKTIFYDLCRLGLCSFLSQISLVISMAAVNNMLYIYGAKDLIFSQALYAQIPMAVVGIVMKFFQIIISIVIGLAAGCIPLVGYNLGAKEYKRTLEIFKKLLIMEFIIGCIGFIIVEFFPSQLILIFGASKESAYYSEFALKVFRIYLCLLPLACINKATFIFLQSMGKAMQSTFLSMFREIILGVGTVICFSYLFGLNGILLSMPISDGITFLVTCYLIYKTSHQLKDKIKTTI